MPSTKLWTKDQYHRMIEVGLLGPSDRVELIEGEIVAMSPQNTPHMNAIMRGTTTLVKAFSDTHFIRVQLPFNAGGLSEPEPDFCLIRKDAVPEDGAPERADLIIEVSDTTVEYDRDVKLRLYARAQVQEYWILNLVSERLEVYSTPIRMGEQSLDFGYRTHRVILQHEMCAPEFAPEISIQVANLF